MKLQVYCRAKDEKKMEESWVVLQNFFFGGGGGRTSFKIYVKKLHSIIRYAEGIYTKQALVAAKFVEVQWGSMLGTLLF